MKKITQIALRLYPLLGSLVVLIAVYGGVKPFSILGFYQPNVPKSLK